MEAFPLSYSDRLFQAAGDDLDVAIHSLPNARNAESYDGRSACQGYGTCSPVCPSGASYSADVHARKAEDEGARVIDQVPVTRLEHDEDDRVEAAVYVTPDGEEHRQEAREFVVACGGIETPRLLLLSDSERYPDGLANSSGAVGRYLMEHPLVAMGGTLDEPTRQGHVGFTSGGSHEFYEHDDPTPGSFQLQLFNGVEPLTVPALADGAWGDDVLATLEHSYGHQVGLMALVEQLPEERNRVTLDTSTTDDHGNPVPEIVWDVGTHGTETAERAIEVQRELLEEMGATITWEDDPQAPNDGHHPMGTTRMGTDPETSVVDPQLTTHDLENLSISSSSVFVTGGAANPTLTIAALTLRLADHLHDRL